MTRIGILALVVLFGCRDRTDAKRTDHPPAPATPAAKPAPDPMPSSYAALVGDKPATLGKALGNLRFGEIIDPAALPQVPATTFGFLGEIEPRHFSRGLDEPGPKVMVNLEIRAGKLFAFRIELYTEKGSVPEDSCAGFAQALQAKWGPAPERVWVDRDAHVRAALRDTCILSFERYVDVASWIGPEPTAIVPAFAVGKPAKELASRVGPAVKLDEDVTYRDAGVGENAAGPTIVDVYMKKGKVTGVGVETAADAADRNAIRQRISTAFKAKPTRDAITGYDVWATTPPIRVLDNVSSVRVEVGNLTP